MLSVAPVRSAGGAASYFAKDDYYTGEHASEMSEWGGEGAAALGLAGEVGKATFETLLNGALPDGTVVNAHEHRRAGIDLTFSMPKSASVLAYVAGDERLLAAHRLAVRQTMAWAERKFAEARSYDRNRSGEAVLTGNLVYAMFQHDTSRKLDPQAHIHVVIAAITRTAVGQWRALWNGELWKNNAAIGSAYHAALRSEIEKLGYETRITGKHGQFEIEGVPKAVIDAFSQRRADILAKAAELGRGADETRTLREITRRTRDDKINLEDREALRGLWLDRAAELGFSGTSLVSSARERSAPTPGREGLIGTLRHAGEIMRSVRENVGTYLLPDDPLATNGLARLKLSPQAFRSELAVASALRIMGQREAAFAMGELASTALNLGIKGVTIERVEARIGQLLGSGTLIPGVSERADAAVTHVTTPAHLAAERKLLDGIDTGRGQGAILLPADRAVERLQNVAGVRLLSAEQLAAGIVALSSPDRFVVIQGVAGAGKTTLIRSVSAVAGEQGRDVLGLAMANKMVDMLRDEGGIAAETVAAFVHKHRPATGQGAGQRFEASREVLAGKILVLDEGSLVSTEAMNDLVHIANCIGVERVVMIGDRKQLQPIDAGKAFSLVQSHGPAIAHLEESLRQRTDAMKAVAGLARAGAFREAFEVLGERVTSVGVDYRMVAARRWLALSPAEQEQTALYASGRETRSELNALVQTGLRAQGVLVGEGLELTTLQKANATREELRMVQTYRKGQVVEVFRRDRPAGLDIGRYEVLSVNGKGIVTLRDEAGERVRFSPGEIVAGDQRDALALNEPEKIRVYAGDRIRWSANDKERALFNSAEARVLGIDADGVCIENARGESLTLRCDDPMLERLGLAYAINMHQAQGMTSDKGIGVMHSSERILSNQRLAYVMATRVRDNLEIVTNDRNALLRTIEGNRGDKTSALEAIGEKVVDPPSGTARSTGRRSESISAGVDPASLRAEPEKHQGVQVPLPAKRLDLGL
jgi:conjugative relaxase-like TrwC/TraI family protein